MQFQRVLIIGSGLLGASLGLRLRMLGVEVFLEDNSPMACSLARDLGAGVIASKDEDIRPDLVIVAVPPDVTPRVVCETLERFDDAIVTDVASVKKRIAEGVNGHSQAHRYIGSHPMAGRERSGAIAADADLFEGRPWVVCAGPTVSPDTVLAIQQLALEVGAMPVMLEPAEHDRAVALVSHVPQLVSSLVAGTLRGASAKDLGLAGQGLRDVTRIASSDSALWTSIIAGNSRFIAPILEDIGKGALDLAAALRQGEENPGAPGVTVNVAQVIKRGNDGVDRIPGKHGGAPERYTHVFVLIPDKPGELGRLFSDIRDIGANVEDFSLEHSVSQQVGRGEISVIPSAAKFLASGLEERGWQVFIEGGEQ
ncbi:prephenate dehydrogenase [Actinotignum urinale]|uniref:Prephenate dehydrogenase n=1 Tax=Actinotignum urinale TaxID=190146 RepID=A0AAW9HU02_9ACTO|nr:prephenate dehydrogenase [Actinotignum urinale]MDY5154553.1 prephenate dehydrogenase [Actinotignum urinale]